MADMFYLKEILDFIDNTYDDINLIFKDIQGYTNNEMEKRLMKRLLRIKTNYLLGKGFKENQKKGKRKGTRFMYFRQIRDAFNEGKLDLVEAFITYARVFFKVNHYSRQTIWRLKKELKEVGLSDDLLKQLTIRPSD